MTDTTPEPTPPPATEPSDLADEAEQTGTTETPETTGTAERAARRDREKASRERAQALEQERDSAITERDGLRAELDTTRAALESLQRHAIESHIKDIGAKAFWKLAPPIADLLTPDGRPDPKAVAAAVAEARDELGLPRHVFPQRQMGMRLGVGAPPDGMTPSLADAFRPRDN